MQWLPFFVFISLIVAFSGCKSENKTIEDSFSIDVRIKKDPNLLNPVKSGGSIESELNHFIFLPLANYHPQTLKLIPVLLESIPEGQVLESGEHRGSIRYNCRIKEAAQWDDGKAVNGYDYLFTIKAIKFDRLKVNPSVKSVFKELIDIEIDPDNNKLFSVYIDKDFILSKELALITEVLPEHIYDPRLSLRNLDLDNGVLSESLKLSKEETTKLDSFVLIFNHADCGKKLVEGSGPYKLESWQTNQKVTIVKKENWWGEAFQDNPYLQSNPDRISYKVYPSINAALTALKNDDIDVLNSIDGSNFQRLKEDNTVDSAFNFYNPSLLKYYFIGMNNHSTFLRDIKVRKALAHLLDVDAFIRNNEHGFGIRVPAPIIPSRSYFNDTLSLVKYDPEKAINYLQEAGWNDSNNNGTVDKILEGNLVELDIKMLITGRLLGKNLALTLKERAKDVGINIDIVTKDSKLIRAELANRNFDLYPTGTTYGLYPEDLYQSWHSDNDYPGGSNRYGFSNPDADKLIEEIRETKDSSQLDDLYKQLQELIYEEQAFIFLYAPTNNIAINREIDPIISVIKPGYFLNSATLSQ